MLCTGDQTAKLEKQEWARSSSSTHHTKALNYTENGFILNTRSSSQQNPCCSDHFQSTAPEKD